MINEREVVALSGLFIEPFLKKEGILYKNKNEWYWDIELAAKRIGEELEAIDYEYMEKLDESYRDVIYDFIIIFCCSGAGDIHDDIYNDFEEKMLEVKWTEIKHKEELIFFKLLKAIFVVMFDENVREFRTSRKYNLDFDLGNWMSSPAWEYQYEESLKQEIKGEEKMSKWGKERLLNFIGKNEWFREIPTIEGELVNIELEKAERIIIEEALKDEIGVIFIYAECQNGYTKAFISAKWKGREKYKEIKEPTMQKTEVVLKLFKQFENEMNRKMKTIIETNVNSNDLEKYIKNSPKLDVKHFNNKKISYDLIKEYISNVGGFYDDWKRFEVFNRKK